MRSRFILCALAFKRVSEKNGKTAHIQYYYFSELLAPSIGPDRAGIFT
jgi:hypothetical protein